MRMIVPRLRFAAPQTRHSRYRDNEAPPRSSWSNLALEDRRAKVETNGGLHLTIEYDDVVVGIGAVPSTTRDAEAGTSRSSRPGCWRSTAGA